MREYGLSRSFAKASRRAAPHDHAPDSQASASGTTWSMWSCDGCSTRRPSYRDTQTPPTTLHRRSGSICGALWASRIKTSWRVSQPSPSASTQCRNTSRSYPSRRSASATRVCRRPTTNASDAVSKRGLGAAVGDAVGEAVGSGASIAAMAVAVGAVGVAPAPVGRGGVTVGAVGEAVGADGTTAAVLAAAATVAVADGAAGVDVAVVVGATTVGVVAGRVPSDHRSLVGLVPRTPTMASTAIVPIVKAMERPDNCRITSLQVGRKASRAFVSFAQRQSVRTAQPASPMIEVAEVLRSATSGPAEAARRSMHQPSRRTTLGQRVAMLRSAPRRPTAGRTAGSVLADQANAEPAFGAVMHRNGLHATRQVHGLNVVTTPAQARWRIPRGHRHGDRLARFVPQQC